MSRRPDTSPQTVALLVELLDDPTRWRHGYELAKATGLASGTLYPILARLAERAYLERQWEAEPTPGRPPRHLYRLTALGTELAHSARRHPAEPARPRSSSPRPKLAGA
jgi:DNA-binding PadR family transcriptional regulator